MSFINKRLLAATIVAFLASPVLAQTSSTDQTNSTNANATGSAASTNPQGVNATTTQNAQLVNNLLMSRLYGGLNAGVLNGQQTATGGIVNPTTAGTNPGATGTLPAANPTVGTLPSQQGGFQQGAGYTSGVSAAQPGAISQGMGPAAITNAQQTNSAFLNQSGLNNNGARTAPSSTTSVAPATGTFNMGTGVPGSGVSTPGTIVQGSGNPAEQAGQPNLNADAFNSLYSGLGTAQTSIPGVTGPSSGYLPGTTTPMNMYLGNGALWQGRINGVQQTSPLLQGTTPGVRPGLQGTALPNGLRQTTPGGR
jgi:hypothetical protein